MLNVDEKLYGQLRISLLLKLINEVNCPFTIHVLKTTPSKILSEFSPPLRRRGISIKVLVVCQ